MIESIEKLRESLKDCASEAGVEPNRFDTYWITARACDVLIDEIEAEIAERYMELPVDADGVPIRCGDTVSGGMGDSGKVQHVEIWPDGFVVVYERQPGQFTRYSNDAVHHVKPRTIEDVLTDFANEVARQGHQIGLTGHELTMRYADEIRELMEVDR